MLKVSKTLRATGFPPLATPAARVLILGSMPGTASLKARQYYAHPQNQFWRLVHELFGGGPELGYPERVLKLAAGKIAVWDVLKHCERAGSLDASILRGSEVANDFSGFFRRHPHIQAVFFNGARAEQAFRRHVLPLLRPRLNSLKFRRLPSTSPAHAGRSFQQKLREWRCIKECL